MPAAKISPSQAKSLRTLISLGGNVDVTPGIPGINRAGLIGMGKLGLIEVTLTEKGALIKVLDAGRQHPAAQA